MEDFKKRYGIIYKIRNKSNNKVYIGQTIKKYGFDQRYSYDLYKNTKNIHLKSSIEKYGIDNFEITKEFDIAYNKDELDRKEKYWISFYKSTDPKYGYNYQDGGSNGSPNEETRLKMSLNNPKYLLGKHHSEKTRQKMSLSAKKRGAPIIPPSSRKKAREKLIGRKLSISTIEKIKESRKDINQHGANNPNAKRIKCLTTGKIFETTKMACEFYNIKRNLIYKSCKDHKYCCGKLPSGEKLYWEYSMEE